MRVHPVKRFAYALIAIAALSLVLLPVLAGVVFGGDVPTLIVTPSGYWLMEFGEDGVPLPPVKVTSVLVRDGGSVGGGGEIIPPVEKTPGPAEDHGEPPVLVQTPFDAEVVDYARRAAVEVGRSDDAQILGLVYDYIEDKYLAGELTTREMWESVKQATDFVLGTETGTGTEGLWRAWRGEMGRLTTGLLTAGKLTEVKDIGVYLKSVSLGLQASVPAGAGKLKESQGVAIWAACDAVMKKVKAEMGADGGKP